VLFPHPGPAHQSHEAHGPESAQHRGPARRAGGDPGGHPAGPVPGLAPARADDYPDRRQTGGPSPGAQCAPGHQSGPSFRRRLGRRGPARRLQGHCQSPAPEPGYGEKAYRGAGSGRRA